MDEIKILPYDPVWPRLFEITCARILMTPSAMKISNGLSSMFPDDREAYTDGKTDYVQSVPIKAKVPIL